MNTISNSQSASNPTTNLLRFEPRNDAPAAQTHSKLDPDMIDGIADIPALYVDGCVIPVLVELDCDRYGIDAGRMLVVDFAGPRTPGNLCLIDDAAGDWLLTEIDELEPAAPIVAVVRDVLPLDISKTIGYGSLNASTVF